MATLPAHVASTTAPSQAATANWIEPFDVRHRLSVSLQYDLPWFDADTGPAHHLLGGWHVNAIFFTAQTGSANGVLYGGDTTNTGVGSWPDMIADPVLPGSERSVPPPPGRFGNSPRLTFHNPGFNNVDLMVV